MTEEILNVQREGFQGILLKAQSDSNKAMIMLGGSEGGISAAYGVAKAFAEEGVHSLAVAYWGTEQTASALELIPIEIIQTAIHYLKQKGYEKVGIYGVSKGAEMALTAASLIPKLILSLLCHLQTMCLKEFVRKLIVEMQVGHGRENRLHI